MLSDDHDELEGSSDSVSLFQIQAGRPCISMGAVGLLYSVKIIHVSCILIDGFGELKKGGEPTI